MQDQERKMKMPMSNQVLWISSSCGMVVIRPEQIHTLESVPGTTAYLCILTAWSEIDHLEGLIADVTEQLLQLGCECFACYGPFAEARHDAIDVIAEWWEQCSAGSTFRSSDIVTTWHENEPLFDVLDYLFHSSVPDEKLKKGRLIVAVLDATNPKDNAFMSEFLKWGKMMRGGREEEGEVETM
jgi:hypothetical protein